MNDARKRIAAMIAIGLVVGSTATATTPRTAAGPEAGFKLLERLVVLVVGAAAPGGGGGDVGQGVILLAKDLESAKDAKTIDEVFAVRFSRLLSAVRQAATMDPACLYWPLYRYALAEFIEGRTGRAPDWKDLEFMVNDHGGAGVGLGAVADAVLSEVVALHLHLENLSRLDDIRQSYLDKGLKAAGAVKQGEQKVDRGGLER
jgi:hypothetical protein